ncbi:unnamed protein product, partial [Polarella glacialis]
FPIGEYSGVQSSSSSQQVGFWQTERFWKAVYGPEVSLSETEAAVSEIISSYLPIGCVMAVCAAVRHRWQRLGVKERPLLLLAMAELCRLNAQASDLVAVALSAGSPPALGDAAGIERRQVEAAFGSKVAMLLVDLQQLAAIERTVRTTPREGDPASREAVLSPGQVDLAMALLTAQKTQGKSSESLILFLAHKAAELRLFSLAIGTGLIFQGEDLEDLQLSAAMGTDVFAPLANLLGLGRIKDELEDGAFAITHAEDRSALRALLARDGEGLMLGAAEELRQALEAEILGSRSLTALRVSGRAKTANSTWKKMRKKQLQFHEVLDSAALRVILDAEDAAEAERLCFAVRDLVAELWTLAPGREKDYVSNPKANGYRSLHLVAIREGKPFE